MTEDLTTASLGRVSLIDHCEVCGEEELREVLDLGEHPMCDDLVAIGDARRPRTFPIRILFCERCRTAHQKFQVPKEELFPSSYHYRARHTADVLAGMKQLVERCGAELGSLEGLRVLDVGCNDGSLLSIFAQSGARTFGVEPTGAAADAAQAGHKVFNAFFNTALAHKIVADVGKPDIVTFTNVFAHIEDLKGLLEAVGTLLSDTTLLVVENHYLGAVLDRYQFDTFYHEHPRTYSATSFSYIAEALGIGVRHVEFPARYGGNIRVLMRKDAADGGPGAGVPDEEGFEQQLLAMADRVPRWREAKRKQLTDLVRQFGALPAKAFPGRAAILIHILGLDENEISAVYEKPGSMKVGHYVPGTRIPILSDAEFAERPNPSAPLVNFAWHISEEIRGYMRRSGFEGEIVDLFGKEEFEAA